MGQLGLNPESQCVLLVCICPQLGVGDEPKRYYSTLPGPLRGRDREVASSGRRKEEGGQGGGGVRHSLYQSPHLLLLQGYNRQVKIVVIFNVFSSRFLYF